MTAVSPKVNINVGLAFIGYARKAVKKVIWKLRFIHRLRDALHVPGMP